METLNFDKLLLVTAFACMACDGDIDKREVKLIRQLHDEDKVFGDSNIDAELELLSQEIKQDGQEFVKNYFKQLSEHQLTEEEELKLIQVAIRTIEADEKIEYAEIKFFKLIRSKLNIENSTILKTHPQYEEYLEEDIISENYLSKFQFDAYASEDFSVFNSFDKFDDIIKKQ